MPIPVVCVVLEGGPTTLQTVKEALKKKTPVVIVKDSGGAADVLAYAYEKFLQIDSKNENDKMALWNDVKQEIERKFVKFDEGNETKANEEHETNKKGKRNQEYQENSKIGTCLNLVKECIEKKDIMSIFHLDGKSSAKGFDAAILKALLKVNRGIRKLELALDFDRVDVAKDEIFADRVIFEDSEMYVVMFSAIQKKRLEFVRLFLEKGINLEGFLAKMHVFAYKKICKEEINFREKGLELKSFLTIERKLKKKKVKTKEWNNIGSITSIIKSLNKLAREVFGLKNFLSPSNKPSHDLFLWSVLMQNREMAMIFLHETKEDLTLVVVAHLLLSTKLEKEDPESESSKELSEEIAYYEDFAIGLLSECYASDEHKAIQLLVRKIPEFKDTTILKMAVQAGSKKFIAHPACQSYLNQAWNGKFRGGNKYIKLLVCVLCPLVAPFLLKFEERERPQTTDHGVSSNSSPRKTKKVSTEIPNGQLNSNTTAEALKSKIVNYFQHLKFFFRAPFIKCWYNLIMYVAFLILYGIILLSDFYPQIEIKEKILIAWVATLILEEMRQVLADDAPDIRQKLRNYFKDIWNVADIAAILTFLVGVILRFIPASFCDQCFYAARIVFALNYMMFFFRILYIFSIYRELGPKIVMIGKMMIDLFYFMIILLVFIGAYGIASHAILYPNQPLNISLARDVLSVPWWTLFGQLPTDEVSGESCKNETNQFNAEQCASMDIYEFVSNHCDEYKAVKCPSIDWLVPILLAIYAFITNVLMLNLLIALFSNTVSEIQAQTNDIWKMQRYDLVREYESRPILPPPLIVLCHIDQIIRYIIRQFSCCHKNGRNQDNSTFEETSREINELLVWEKVNAEEYLRKKESKNNMDKQEQKTNDKLDLILNEMEENSKRLTILEKLVTTLTVEDKKHSTFNKNSDISVTRTNSASAGTYTNSYSMDTFLNRSPVIENQQTQQTEESTV